MVQIYQDKQDHKIGGKVISDARERRYVSFGISLLQIRSAVFGEHCVQSFQFTIQRAAEQVQKDCRKGTTQDGVSLYSFASHALSGH